MSQARPASILLAVFGIFATSFGAAADTNTSTFNTDWFRAIVSIEVARANGPATPRGTGCLILSEAKHCLLFTARHVIESDRADGAYLVFRFSAVDSGGAYVSDSTLLKDGLADWFLSETDDIACRFVFKPATSNASAIPQSAFLIPDSISVAAPVLILGYPMGLIAEGFTTPIVRSGTVAGIESRGMLIDAFAFPGNSGSPVVYVPVFSASHIVTDILPEQRFVGIVSSYIPYRDTAISAQTHRARVTFEENSGLARVVSAEEVRALLTRDDLRRFEQDKWGQ